MTEVILVIILIFIVLLLILYNLYVKQNFKTVEKSKKRLDDLSVLNDLVKIVGNLQPVNEKLNNINDTLIKKFSIDYSSIVIFDGKEFIAKASNLDKKNIKTIENIHTNNIFAESIQSKEAKYLTVENPMDNLPYLKEERSRAKTAIFFPLYIETVFVGFWLIESRTPKGFNDMDMQIMMEVKSRILDILRTMQFQASIENMVKDDLFSELKTYESLLSEGKIKLEKHNESSVIMYRISNIEKLNNEFSREAGNVTITNVTKAIQKTLDGLGEEYIFVRYSGPKFAIAFPGMSVDNIVEILKSIHKSGESATIMESEVSNKQIEETESFDDLVDLTETNIEESKTKKKKDKKEDKAVQPRLNIVAAKYYRGTALEVLTKELEDFLEERDKESSITII